MLVQAQAFSPSFNDIDWHVILNMFYTLVMIAIGPAVLFWFRVNYPELT